MYLCTNAQNFWPTINHYAILELIFYKQYGAKVEHRRKKQVNHALNIIIGFLGIRTFMFKNRFDVLLASLRNRKQGFLQQALAREFTNLFLSTFWIFFYNLGVYFFNFYSSEHSPH